MSTRDTTPGDLESLVGALSETLRDEYEALSTRDVEKLECVVGHKAALIADIEAALACARADDAPAPDLGHLRGTLEDCVRGNRTNGGAIALNQGLVSTLLDTLYGVSRDGRTYGAHGGLDGANAVRSVGRA